MKEIFDLIKKDAFINEYELNTIFTDNVLKASHLFYYNKKETIIEIGMPLKYLWFLVEGETKIYTTIENGKSYVLRKEEPLRVYGEVEFLNDLSCVAYVEALTDCYILAFPIGVLRGECLNHPPFLRYMVKSLSDRLIRLSYVSTDNILLPLKHKLAAYLLLNMDKQTQWVQLNMPYMDVAEQLGCSYRHLSRTLKGFADEGLLVKEKGKLRIQDYDQLKIIAGAFENFP